MKREECPKGTLAAAKKRVFCHLQSMNLIDFDLNTLAVNCYMQGARDMAETIINRQLNLSVEEVMEYQI